MTMRYSWLFFNLANPYKRGSSLGYSFISSEPLTKRLRISCYSFSIAILIRLSRALSYHLSIVLPLGCWRSFSFARPMSHTYTHTHTRTHAQARAHAFLDSMSSHLTDPQHALALRHQRRGCCAALWASQGLQPSPPIPATLA